MKASVYDTDEDGVVDRAKTADSADSVAWADVEGKPSAFAPEAHRHGMEAVSDPVRQRTRTEADPTALYLDIPVIINSVTAGGATLHIDFPHILERADGAAFAGQPGDCLTWEYHVKCSAEVTSVAIGGLESTMEIVSIPDTLPLVNGSATWHVFAIRGMYRNGAANNLRLQVNYCYSYGA